eukprot:s224_g15.t1
MSVVVSNLAGSVLAEISPVPTCLADLNLQIEKITGIPSTLQKLVKDGEVLTSTGHFPEEAFDVLCIKDETPLYSWDVQGNPDSHHIEVEGAVVRCPNLRTDYCNVLTKEPMRSGLHYYEFVLHKAVVEFEKACTPGNVIGMLVDVDKRLLAFALDGRLQGACKLAGGEPLYVMTHVDTPEDHVEPLLRSCRNTEFGIFAILWIPMGLFQGVIVLLAYDEYLDRQDRQQHGQSHQHRETSAWNRYHCKAVAALCEGLPAITVLACAWWSLNYPPEKPLMKMSWHFERIILFISAGSGMVELDFCCSGAAAREMRKSLRYEMLHLLFRFCPLAKLGFVCSRCFTMEVTNADHLCDCCAVYPARGSICSSLWTRRTSGEQHGRSPGTWQCFAPVLQEH